MTKMYFTEGDTSNTHNPAEYFSDIAGLERAKDEGVILEGKAVLCDALHNLHVEIGKYKGIIPKEEALYNPTGEPVKDIAVITRVGKTVCFKITEINKTESGIHLVLSRRLAQKECFENYLMHLGAGDVIDASITHMENFGAFCDIGCGMIALLPIDCISVSRISHPEERLVCGQKLKCVVKNIEPETKRITLTHKELLGTWEENARMFSPGETVAGIIRSIEPYGIFVELTPNLAGLAEYCEGVKEGQTAAVYIKSIIPEKMKIKLVIVDTSEEFYDKPREPEYYLKEKHIDSWRYSPDGCIREICSVFWSGKPDSNITG